ncbi:SHOCT domain-containing protein [Actinomadura sp. NAK00032]|uniref:SHOCT domain-containing protein n=1 Tax=Actinomadura sp. NAK00032 TaxID=2742128 RepID=UPI001C37B065|nr:SHOCT domain-containing protein [Actinomadura sp. NAK00032]
MMTTLAAQAAQVAAMHPGGWQDGDAPAFWPVFPITFGLFWLAVLGTVFYLIRRRTGGGGGGAAAAAPDPLAKARSVLAERFARGEIDEDEYLRRTSALNSD